MNTPYPTLLSPIRVGRIELPNRIVMGSLHTRLENEPDAARRLAAFYAARARGQAALITTGGCSPNVAGRVEPGAQVLDRAERIAEHLPIVRAVHAHGSRIILQVLHTGAYAKHDEIVAPSAVRSPINPRIPRAMTADEILETIEDYARCAELAREAGYDGIELMGSEGYLLNQFLVRRTNRRDDEWGGSFDQRMRMPLRVVGRIRERVGRDFLMFYRLSAIDLVEDGMTGDEILLFARALEAAGVDVLSTGIGWHESGVPTIATSVPRAAYAFAAARITAAVSVPVVVSNRINMPDTAEQLLSSGQADLVSLARPFLADPDFVRKAAQGRAAEITPCIGCNQACLDYIFSDRVASCLVNPRACRETEFDETPAARSLRIAVVGAGPAGMACAIAAAQRGHRVDLYEAQPDVGGQLDLARRIPGKEREFDALLRHYRLRLEQSGVALHLNTMADAGMLAARGYDHVVVATGTRPRDVRFEGYDHAKVLSYPDLILGRAQAGDSVAVIGAGGVGHDVAEWLTATRPMDADGFLRYWGVDAQIRTPGGLAATEEEPCLRQVTLFQRGLAKPRLGKSTGWIHRARLARRGVALRAGCAYHKVDDRGLHYSIDGQPHLAEVDTIVVCAGQEPVQDLAVALQRLGVAAHLIGGARIATGLDAMRAIDEGTRLAYAL